MCDLNTSVYVRFSLLVDNNKQMDTYGVPQWRTSIMNHLIILKTVELVLLAARPNREESIFFTFPPTSL
jgi:hypothetical protein